MGDAADLPLDFIEPFGTVLEHREDQKTPFVAELIENVP
jgi:hypothetical protein